MCGIFGVIDPDGDRLSAVRRRLPIFEQRGPDGAGEYEDGALAMGMRRLAVIDVDKGWQPLFAADGQVVAFQNGEIYNHAILRRDLQAAGIVFRTDSDTEVLAHGYALWGIDGLLERVDGMYALAIYDQRRGMLHLARDRAGEKPLFFAGIGDRFAYGSSLFALASLPWLPLDINRTAIDRYLALQYVPGPHTPFRYIQRLLPGERLEVPVNRPRPVRVRYHRPRLRPQQPVSDTELLGRLDHAVRSRLVADVPIGVFLSGGIDSSVVAALAARAQPGIATFSIGFEDPRFDETPYAAAVARHIGSTHHAFRFGKADFDDVFDHVTACLDEPLGDQALLPTYLLSREARRLVTVALSGEGADEVFAGYEHYAQFAPDAVDARCGRGAADLARIRRLADPDIPFTPAGVPHLLSAADRRALTGWHDPGEAEPWERDLADWLDDATCPLQRATAADFAVSLPDRLLSKVDRASMGNSLEVRAPFLQPELVEAGLGLPAGERMTRTAAKRALRHVASSLLPPAVLMRPKQVFAVPLLDWLWQRVSAAGGPRAYARAHAMPGLDSDLTGRLLERAFAPGIHSNLAFSLCMLLEWHDRVAGVLCAHRSANTNAPILP